MLMAANRTEITMGKRLVMAALLGLGIAGPASAAEEIAERTPLQTVVPEYPASAMRERVEGEVQVCFYIDRKGRPYRIAVRNSSHRVFERPSIAAVRASTYAPLAPGEKLPTIKTCRTFRFSLAAVQPDVSANDGDPGDPAELTR